MANIKSAKKRAELSERSRVRIVAYKSSIRTALRRVLEAIKAYGDIAARVSQAHSLIDRAVLKGILHKNNGARLKSRLSKRVLKAAS